MTNTLRAPRLTPPAPRVGRRRPRLGFLGLGWIGLDRFEAVARTGLIEVAGLADPNSEAVGRAQAMAPDAATGESLEQLLELDLDGLVIATPSAHHADQALQALERGVAVFCQKPLARCADEISAILAQARTSDCLLGVDLSYRHLAASQAIRELIRQGALGHVYALDLVFHNAYGPDKEWFYDPRLSGGGCVMDLGIHLADLALWLLDWPGVTQITSRLFAKGCLLTDRTRQVEDYATAQIDLVGGATAQLTCSWHLPAGCDARIEVSIYGTAGGACLRNVNGSFYDFVGERLHGTRREILTQPPEVWGGRAAVEWATRLAAGERFDPGCESLLQVADVLDSIYEAARF